MKRVIGIIGSPRRLGNCELIVKEIASNLPEPVELSMIRMVEQDIKPCKACYRCLFDVCPIKDDFGKVLDAIASSDGMIVAAPVYLLGTNSSLQKFLDRGLQFWKRLDDLSGKPAVAVAMAGVRDGEGSSLLGVENFARAMDMKIMDRAVIHAALPGEAVLSEAGLNAAKRLAAALFSPQSRETDPKCGVCGGTYFEFRGGSRLYCLLCGASGSASIGAGGLTIDMNPPVHSWRGPTARKAHGEWLIGMKEKYRAERENLKAVAGRYAGGNFI